MVGELGGLGQVRRGVEDEGKEDEFVSGCLLRSPGAARTGAEIQQMRPRAQSDRFQWCQKRSAGGLAGVPA